MALTTFIDAPEFGLRDALKLAFEAARDDGANVFITAKGVDEQLAISGRAALGRDYVQFREENSVVSTIIPLSEVTGVTVTNLPELFNR